MASRRDCERVIHEGRVRVNNEMVTALPVWVDPTSDRIEVDGRCLAKRPNSSASNLIYVILHKPRHVICTSHDPQGRRTVLDLVNLSEPRNPRISADPRNRPRTHHPEPRIFPVGRLDADSTGLLFLTNDGDLTNRLTHPRYGVAKHYRVMIQGRLTNKDVEKLKEGLFLTHRSTSVRSVDPSVPAAGLAPPVRVSAASGSPPPLRRGGWPAKKSVMTAVRILRYHRDRAGGDRTDLLLILKEGQNREIRRMLARLGYNVRRLCRVGIGPIRLRGLASGQWRMLAPAEVSRLRRATGL